MVKIRRLGRKSGVGWYSYKSTDPTNFFQSGEEDDQVTELLERFLYMYSLNQSVLCRIDLETIAQILVQDLVEIRRRISKIDCYYVWEMRDFLVWKRGLPQD